MAIGDGFAVGYAGFIGVAQQVTLTTKVTATAFLEFTSEGFKREITEHIDESINTTRDHRKRLLMEEVVTGSFETNLNAASDAQVYVLRNALGGTLTSAQVAATAAYKHTLTAGDMEEAKKALTFTVRRGRDSNHMWDFLGCRINQLTIAGVVGEPVRLTADIVGMTASLSTADSLTAVFPATLPFIFKDATITLTGTAETIVGFELTINNNIATDSNARALGTRALSVMPPLQREVRLKLTQRFDTTTAYDRFINQKDFAAVITLDTGVTIGAAGSSNYSMLITVNALQVNSNMPMIGDKGILVHELDCVSVPNTSTTEAIFMQVNNATTSY